MPTCTDGIASIGHGTRVTWQLPTRIETVVLSLALARLGAVQNPILPLYRDREVGFVVAQTDAEVFCVPGDWNGFDFVAMAARIAEETGVHPKVLVTYDSSTGTRGTGATQVHAVDVDVDDPHVRVVRRARRPAARPAGRGVSSGVTGRA